MKLIKVIMNKFLMENSRVTDVFKQVLGNVNPELTDTVIGMWPILGRKLVMAVNIPGVDEEVQEEIVDEVIRKLKEVYQISASPYSNKGYFGIIRDY